MTRKDMFYDRQILRGSEVFFNIFLIYVSQET